MLTDGTSCSGGGAAAAAAETVAGWERRRCMVGRWEEVGGGGKRWEVRCCRFWDKRRPQDCFAWFDELDTLSRRAWPRPRLTLGAFKTLSELTMIYYSLFCRYESKFDGGLVWKAAVVLFDQRRVRRPSPAYRRLAIRSNEREEWRRDNGGR
jgi:hypothetical protein